MAERTTERGRGLRLSAMDGVWLVFLAGVAALPPIREVHKQLILLGFGLFQLLEGRLRERMPRHAGTIAVLVKIVLATLLIAHTGEVAINSIYYPIFYLPVLTAAMYFGPLATLLWTAAASGDYLSYLWPALRNYRLDPAGIAELEIRVLFFFLLALIVNRFAMETRHQRDLYREAAESLEAANRQLLQAQADARRSERLAALGQLSAGLAHEIRNPLGVIKGSAEMLEKTLGAENPVAVELSGYISSEVNRVNALVSRFLDFARPLRLELRPVAVAELLDRALREVAEAKPEARVAVVRQYAADLGAVALDETLCERVFINLAANAFEAMAPGGGTLTVYAARGEVNGQPGAEIIFQDTGPGVPAELREQIFNPFVTTKKTGVGLGLSIVSKIVDQHGGRVRLGGGPGARFEVFLPVPEGGE